MIWAALRLYEAIGEARFLEAAERWASVLDKHYWSDGKGGYAMAADDTEDVIVRLTPGQDDATPNANAIMLSNLAALGLLSGKPEYAARAIALTNAFASQIAANPIGHAGMLAGAMDHIAPQLIVIYPAPPPPQTGELSDALHRLSLPGASELIVQSAHQDASAPALEGKRPHTGRGHRIRMSRHEMFASDRRRSNIREAAEKSAEEHRRCHLNELSEAP